MFLNRMRSIARDDRGATAVEYAIIVVGIAVALVLGLTFVGSQVSGTLTAAGEGLGGGQPVAMGQTAEQAAAEQAAAEQALRDAEEKAAADEAAAQAAAAQAAADKAAADKAAADKAAADKAAADAARAKAIKDCEKNKNFSWNYSTNTCVKDPGKNKDKNDDD